MHILHSPWNSLLLLFFETLLFLFFILSRASARARGRSHTSHSHFSIGVVERSWSNCKQITVNLNTIFRRIRFHLCWMLFHQICLASIFGKTERVWRGIGAVYCMFMIDDVVSQLKSCIWAQLLVRCVLISRYGLDTFRFVLFCYQRSQIAMRLYEHIKVSLSFILYNDSNTRWFTEHTKKQLRMPVNRQNQSNWAI